MSAPRDDETREAARLERLLEGAREMAERGETDAECLAASGSVDRRMAEPILRGALAFEAALAPDAEERAIEGTTLERERSRQLELPAPELPEDYEVRGEIGRGGMGVVYRVHQRSLERDVAVKVLMPGELRFAQALDRFRREAKSLAKLRHRHIVAIHDVGEVGGSLFYSMDLIEGGSLAERLADGPLAPAPTLRIMRQITSAVAYTHGAGLVHRDLKPANVLLDEEGDAFVVDFGLASDTAWERGLTSTGHVLGTPDFMSPEQARGEREAIGEASDIYALGAILYVCLTGVAPFGSLPIADKIHAVVYESPRAPRKRNPKVPRDLETICLKAMAKRPDERYATARALLEDLERFDEGRSIRARRARWWQVGRRAVRRHARELVAGALVGLTALALSWMSGAGRAEALFKERLGAAERLLDAGEARAARMTLDEALASLGEDSLDGELQRRVDRTRARCLLIEGSEWLQAGRAEEGRALLERAARGLELASDGIRYSRATGWPRIRFEILADLAMAQAQLGDRAAALATFARFDGGLVQGPWMARLSDWMAPRLADPSDPGHPAAVLFVAEAVDWSTPGAFGDWLARYPEDAARALGALLGSLDLLASGRRQLVEDGLIRRNALASRALFTAGQGSENSFPLTARIQEHLAGLAGDDSAGGAVRRLSREILGQLAEPDFEPQDLDPGAYRLRLAHLAWLEGRSRGEVLWTRDYELALGEPVRVRVVERDVHPVFESDSNPDWLQVRAPSLNEAPPGTLVLELEGAAASGGAGVRFDIERFDYDLAIGGPKDWWSVRRAGHALPAGRVAPLGYREYGWPRHGTHASVELVVAVLDPLEEEGTAKERAFDPTSLDSWRERLAREIRAEAAELVALSREGGDRAQQDVSPGSEVLEFRDPLDTWIADLPKLHRTAMTNQWILAGILPVPEAREALASISTVLRASGSFDALLDDQTPFPRSFEPGGAFERSMAQLAAARLAAGDALVLDESDVVARLDDFSMTRTQWAHRVLDAQDARIREYAWSRLDSPFTSDALWITLDGALEAATATDVPAFGRAAMEAAPRNLLREELKLLGRGNWFSLGLLLVALIFVALLRGTVLGHPSRVELAGTTFLLVFTLLGRTVQLGPIAVPCAPFAVLLAWASVRQLEQSLSWGSDSAPERRSFTGRASMYAGLGLAFLSGAAAGLGGGELARWLSNLGVVLAWLGIAGLYVAVAHTSDAHTEKLARAVFGLTAYLFFPLVLAHLVRSLCDLLGGFDVLHALAAHWGLSISSLETALGLAIYLPFGALILALATVALALGARLREREELEASVLEASSPRSRGRPGTKAR